ncbi:hypothetical protein D5S17_06095 [Pseudonocardiaceae bacterium YIM PH 21723]|nr:hypothetical protein D5S17_06095 [Pseudonocardiaceae bacterium YIM PH 21723]
MLGLQAAGGLVYVLAPLVHLLATGKHAGNEVGTSVYFLLLTAALAVLSWGMLRGRTWSRTPAVVLQLLLLGSMWTIYGSRGQIGWWVLTSLPSLAIVVLLFVPAANAWAFADTDED